MSDVTRYGMPGKVVFCRRCVISNQRPGSNLEFKNPSLKRTGITIDSSGVCDACKVADLKNDVDWESRERSLMKILDGYRSKDGSYDVVVPSSGGKDSSFTAHVLKDKYGMNPLCVTWAPMIWTEDGWSNFDNLSRIGGIDSILVTPNGDVHRFLTQRAFANLGHPFQPFIHGQKIVGPKIAKTFGIKLVMYGESGAEYGNNASEFGENAMSTSFFSHDNPLDMLLGGRPLKNLLETSPFSFGDFSNYVPLTTGEISRSKIQQTYLGYFERWNPQEVYYYATQNTGFRPARRRSPGTYSRYSEIDDKFIPLNFYMMYLKFGLGRTSYEASQEIRNGQISREEGVRLVRKFDGELDECWHSECLEYLNLSPDEFMAVADGFRPEHLWMKERGEYRLREVIS